MNAIPIATVSPKKRRFPAVGKIYVKIPVRVESPFLIGSGEDENSDLDVIRESCWRELAGAATFPSLADKNKETHILIPASSLTGVFRAFLRDFAGQNGRDEFNLLFGEEAPGENMELLEGENPQYEKKPQSALQCEDVLLENAKIKMRDGVRIDHKTNLAEDEGKYDYEIVEYLKDKTIPLNLKITQRHIGKTENVQRNVSTEYCHQIVDALIKGINAGRIRLGAKTNKGFGKLRVQENEVKIAVLDFKNSEDVKQWLSNEPAPKDFPAMAFTPLAIEAEEFEIEAYFQLKSSLLVRSYSVDPGAPDVVAMESFGEGVIPGPSLRGAIRHRAAKILRTVCPLTEDEKARDWVNEKVEALFGYVDENKKLAQRGRFVIEETPVRDVVKEVQTRIKIDRFTGGTIHGALLEAMPLWQKSSGGNGLCLKMAVRKFEKWEAGLFLHILKDLWTGDLALGGEKSIGRGVLKAFQHPVQKYAAKICWNGESVTLDVDEKGAPVAGEQDWKKLENFATAFNEAMQNATC